MGPAWNTLRCCHGPCRTASPAPRTQEWGRWARCDLWLCHFQTLCLRSELTSEPQFPQLSRGCFQEVLTFVLLPKQWLPDSSVQRVACTTFLRRDPAETSPRRQSGLRGCGPGPGVAALAGLMCSFSVLCLRWPGRQPSRPRGAPAPAPPHPVSLQGPNG